MAMPRPFIAILLAGGCLGTAEAEPSALLREQAPVIAFARHAVLGGSHYSYTEALSDAQNERTFLPGSRLCLLSLGPGGKWKEETLLNSPQGMIRDVDVSFDAKRLLFAWKKSDRGDDFHLYELTLATRALRQLTDAPHAADYEGCYLPDGSIIFNSTRCVQTVDCWWTEVSNLYTCDADGHAIRRLTYDQVHNNYPTLSPDGRILYTRWEYNDRGQLYPQPLFSMNTDGTSQRSVYGDNSWFPTSILHARGIPGAQKILAIASGHHVFQAGKLIRIDPLKGRQEAEGVTLLAPARAAEAVCEDRYGQDSGALFLYPYPLSESEFLVVCNPDGWLQGRQTGFGLYWMNERGERELLTPRDDLPPGRPVPVMPRAVPRFASALPADAPRTGTFYIQNVYIGQTANLERGAVKRIRAVALSYRAAGIGYNCVNGPAGFSFVSTPVSINNGSWDVKTILGEVPVEADGSAFFTAPAETPIYFQLLDSKGRLIHSMRSWTVLQRGENAACVGCHESKNSSARPSRLAANRKPAALEPLLTPVRGFSFRRDIQPILDRRCIRCHSPAAMAATNSENKTPAKGDLSGTPVRDEVAKRLWSASYLTLTQWGRNPSPLLNWIPAGSVPSPLKPYAYGSATSSLFAKLDGNHGETTEAERRLLAAWVDLGVPFCGDYREANLWSPDETARYDHFEEKRNRLSNGTTVAPGQQKE